MADVKDAKKGADSKAANEGDKDTEKKGLVRRILPWLISAVVVIFCSSAGFVAGRLCSGFVKPGQEGPEAGVVEGGEPVLPESGAEAESFWYYEMEPVVANLDEPGVKRYVRAALTLEISSGLDPKQGKGFLDEKKPLLRNWLTLYLAGLTLEDTRGDGNQKRIQTQIRDSFNEKLFPDSKPCVKRVLFQEFAVQ